MNGYSQEPAEERIKTLRPLIPEVSDKGKVGWEKLEATLGGNANFANERYVLDWTGKSDIWLATDEVIKPWKRNESDFKMGNMDAGRLIKYGRKQKV
ncbi:MAG: hypothetical protein LBN29_02355 [Mediterranea sp.]|jgi:hypothetical protein|nr:hypothetical protein [Mediterranea sp.]